MYKADVSPRNNKFICHEKRRKVRMRESGGGKDRLKMYFESINR